MIGGDGDVADLAAGADRLAVHVDLDGGVGGHDVDVAVVDIAVVAAEDVGHGGNRDGELRRAKRQVEDGPQVLLELRARPPARPGSAPVPARARLPRGRCRRAGPSAPPGTPRPAGAGNTPPGPRAR